MLIHDEKGLIVCFFTPFQDTVAVFFLIFACVKTSTEEVSANYNPLTMKPVYIIILFCLNIMSVYSRHTTTYDIHSGLPHWVVSGIVQDRQGFIWVATWNGLCRYDGYEFRQIKAKPGDGTHISSEVIRKMELDARGNIVCRTTAGSFMLDTRDYRLYDVARHVPPTITSQEGTPPFTDSEGNRWQIERYGITKTISEYRPASLVSGTEDVQARAFMKDNRQRWWLATKEDETVRIYDKTNRLIGYVGSDGRIHKQKTRFGYRAYCLMQTHGGDVWVGCKPGALLRLRPVSESSFEITRIDSRQCDIIYHIVEDHDGRLWLASFGGGVQCVPNPLSANPEPVGFRGGGEDIGRDKVRRLLVTSGGTLVCATTNGLVVGRIDSRNISKTTFRRLTRDGERKESLCNNAVMDIADDGKGHIFIATENHGIDMIDEAALMDKEPSFTNFNSSNSSLTSDACIAMAVKDSSRIFVVCVDRVMEFEPERDRTVTYARSFWNDRCHFSEERPLRLYDGSWIFGQEQGAYVATCRNMETRDVTPPIRLTCLSVNGKLPDLGVCARDTIFIDTDERNFSLSFAALCYHDNSEICYRSRIGEAAWSVADKQRTLTFYDIQPGEYVLEIQSTDRYGRWVDNNRKVVIVVKYHWYETLWARIMLWLLITGVIAAVVHTMFYIRSLTRQRRELLDKYMSLLDSGKTENVGQDAQRIDSLPGDLSESDRKFLQRVKLYIEENIGNSEANIDDMAVFAASSRSSLNRKLRSLVGITAAQLLINARMRQAARMLSCPEGGVKPNISDVAYKCGYADTRYFSRCFKKKYGVAPSEYSG